MKRILVASDSHGAEGSLRWVLTHERADALVYLGDGMRDLERAIPAKPRSLLVYRAAGNCDYAYPDEPLQGLIAFGGLVFFYTHGHRYGVKTGREKLAATASARGADIALYGHTHVATQEFEIFPGGLRLFNPGSLGFGGWYGILECEGGVCTASHAQVPAAERG